MGLKIAEVPEPPPLTPEDWEKIERDVEEWRRAFKKATEKMEWFDGDEMRIRVR